MCASTLTVAGTITQFSVVCYVNASLPADQPNGAMIQSASPYGPIDYLMLQTTLQFPHAYELVVYIPFGSESHLRYEQFKAQMGANKFYFSE